jgi:hypothetical protein
MNLTSTIYRSGASASPQLIVTKDNCSISIIFICAKHYRKKSLSLSLILFLYQGDRFPQQSVQECYHAALVWLARSLIEH